MSPTLHSLSVECQEAQLTIDASHLNGLAMYVGTDKKGRCVMRSRTIRTNILLLSSIDVLFALTAVLLGPIGRDLVSGAPAQTTSPMVQFHIPSTSLYSNQAFEIPYA